MKRRFCITIAVGLATVSILGCPDPETTLGPPVSGTIEDVVSVVGGMLNSGAVDDDEPARTMRVIGDTGGPTITPPKLRSNSRDSFDVAISGIVADSTDNQPYTIDHIRTLRIGVAGFDGYYAIDVGDDNRLIDGEVLVTILQEDVDLLDPEFTLEIVAEDDEARQGAIVQVGAAFFAASAGTDGFARPGDTVPLVATFEGGSGTPNVTWSQVSGPVVTIDDPFADSTGFVAAEPDSYVMKLESVDPTGVIDVDLVTIVVLDGFAVDAGEAAVISVGDTVPLRATTFGGTGQADFTWTEISTHGVTIEDPDSRVASFVVPAVGEYEFEVTATDEVEGAATDRVIYLAGEGLQTLATAPEQANIGETVQLQGVADGGFYPYAFRWSQTSNLPVALEDVTNQTATATLQSAGTYVFKLTVTDSTGSSATDSATIVVRCQDDTDCDDDDVCTVDACLEGNCVNAPIDVDDGLFCTGIEVCDPVTGEIVSSGDPCEESTVCDNEMDMCRLPCTGDAVCNDGDACTTDTCGSDSFCKNEEMDCPDEQVCRDGNCLTICSDLDDCDDGSFCNGAETCDDGLCQEGVPPCSPGWICDEDTGMCIDPTTVVFFDDFEEGLGEWFASNGLWEVGLPTSGPERAYSGEQVAATVLAGNIPAKTGSRLVRSFLLPVIIDVEEIHLRFWHWFELGDRCGGWCAVEAHVQIREQIAPGEWGPWEGLAVFGRSSGPYTRPLVDLSGYAGKKVQIAFLLTQPGVNGLATPGWYVDDVIIEVVDVS